INAVAFSPDGRSARSVHGDGTIKLWDVATGRELRAFSTDSRMLATFSPDGHFLLSASKSDGVLKLWEVSSGKEVRVFEERTGTICASFSSDGRLALSGGLDEIKLWDVTTGRVLKIFRGYSSAVSAITFSADGHYALSGHWDSMLKL